jgi:hypothetical protein
LERCSQAQGEGSEREKRAARKGASKREVPARERLWRRVIAEGGGPCRPAAAAAPPCQLAGVPCHLPGGGAS